MYDDDDDEKINICHSCLRSSTSYVANNSDAHTHYHLDGERSLNVIYY